MNETEITEYGFKFGAAEYKRAASVDGRTWILIDTPRQNVQIYVTRTGLIRLYGPYKKRGQ